LTLSFVDTSGNPENGVFGTVTWPDGTSQSFDCSADGGHLDAGFVLPCSGASVEVGMLDQRAVTVSVRSVGGGTFSGSIAPMYAPTGRSVCGTPCSAAAVTVTLQ
jgi:hypothetical protein